MGVFSRVFLGGVAGGAFGLAERTFRKSSLEAAERKGQRLGELLYKVDAKHRRRVLSNLEIAFPEWSPEQREATARQNFRHFGLVPADFLRTPVRTPEEVMRSTEVEGREHLEAARSLGKGVLLSSAHLGNWERMPHWFSSAGHPMLGVARRANQRAVESRLSRYREMTGLEVIERGVAARPMIRALREDRVVLLLPDQNGEECFVPFFGKSTGTTLGPAILHQRTGAALLPGYYVRTGPGGYRLVLLSPIDPANEEKDPEAIMTALNLALEGVIRRYPEQYLWMHNRWKASRLRGLV